MSVVLRFGMNRSPMPLFFLARLPEVAPPSLVGVLDRRAGDLLRAAAGFTPGTAREGERRQADRDLGNKVTRRQSHEVSRRHGVKVTRCKDVKVTRCQGD
jgi:hypothetical protein